MASERDEHCPRGLPQTDLLDARIEGDPAPGSVRIPWPDLHARRGELPPKGALLRLIGPPEAAAELRALGYEPLLEADPALPPPCEGSIRAAGEGGKHDAPAPLRLFAIDPLLERWTPQEPGETPGEAADLGCGVGRNAVWLAAVGWRVLAVDRLPKLAAAAADLAARYGQTVETRAAYVEDVLKERRAFDLALLLFCWDRAFLPLLADAVRPGGLLLIATFPEDDAHDHPVAPERVLTAADLARLQNDFDLAHHAPAAPRHDRRAQEAVLRKKREK